MTENQAEYHAQDKPVERVKCVIPDCSILVNPPELGQPPLCKEHLEAFKVFKFFISRVKFQQAPTPPPQNEKATARVVSSDGKVLVR